jgi:hypothetical protein
MKHQTLASLLLLLGALHGAGQGTVRFENNIPGVLVTHFYGADPFYAGRLLGNGLNDFPPGQYDWSMWTPLAGSGYYAQLLAAPGADVPFSSLHPASPVTTFQTGENAGFVVPLIASLQGVPADAPVATVALVAWDTRNGVVTTWAEALRTPNWIGKTRAFNVYDIGGAVNPPPVLHGLVSFSLYVYEPIPEPSAASLLVLGLATAAVLVRRREKRAR